MLLKLLFLTLVSAGIGMFLGYIIGKEINHGP